ncbi:MAG: DsbA family oxidoreductase [Pseudorhodobacter sp.]|nr:DsbA family oxidoreductase [Frankiaceae bacterium]
MRIEIWSDFVCPWCAIGKAHLDQALEQFEHADDTYVICRSFELDPGAPAVRTGEYDRLLAARYGTSPQGGRAMVSRISAACERAGTDARFDLVRPANTFDAHRLLHLAKMYGVQDALACRLTRAYLAEGQVLSDHPTLQHLAEEVGLVPAKIASTLAGDAFAEHVSADEAEAARREVTAVPTFLIDGHHVIPGAQTPDTLLATLRRAFDSQRLSA